MSVQDDAIAAGRIIHGGKMGAYHDTLPTVARDNDIRRWNPTLGGWEWISDGAMTFCPGLRRAAGTDS
jgi:hypothetical protein